MLHTKVIALVLLSVLFVSCSKDKEPKRQELATATSKAGAGIVDESSISPEILNIVDLEGKAILGATMLIGTGEDTPFANNMVASNSDGTVTAPADWTTEESVTISAPGFVRTTFMGQIPQGQTFALRAAAAPKLISLTGTTSGHTIKDFDGLVDFGIVIPSVRRRSFFDFDITSFISPLSDNLSVFGMNLSIPKNVSLPFQKESYFFTIELNKPQYELNFSAPGNQMIFVARGNFRMDTVINEIRSGKEFYELTNLFDIKGGAVREINLQSNSTLNIPVNELNYTGTRQVLAPPFKQDEVVLSAALATWKGWYYPTDLKLLEANKTKTMKTASSGTPYLLSILKRKSETKLAGGDSRLSANFRTFDSGQGPTFLPLMANPIVTSKTRFTISPVTAPAGIVQGAQYSVLSKITKTVIGGTSIDIVENVWDVYSANWNANNTIPTWPGEKALTGQLRWEVTLTGLPNQNVVQDVELGPKWLEAATHATRASKDF